MPNEVSQLKDEAERASEMLRGKVVARVIRHRPTEVLLEFTDGTRFLWTVRPMHWNFQSLVESEDEFAHQNLMP